MKKKIKVEYLLYLFIIITPFLDAIACLFRNWFPNASISPSTILRPLIPVILIIYIFIKDKKYRKYIVISGVIFIVYGCLHLLIYNKLLTGISYGGVFSEAQYIINYTYMVYVLFIFMYFIKNKELKFLKTSLFIMLCSYLGIIYLSIVTRTSYPTYVEGMGYRGWFTSGNSIGTILLILLCTLISRAVDSKEIKKYIVLVLLGIYLIFLLGTRTGLIGFIGIVILYLIVRLIGTILKNKKVSYKMVGIVICCFVMVFNLIWCLGSETIDRRKHLDSENAGIIDINTSKYGHTTGDTSTIVYQIINNQIDDSYLNKEQKKAYLEMYNYCNKKEIDSSNRRIQQIIYHYYLMKEQKNIVYILFGNGYLSSYGEMVLEMEILAIIFNFGIIGFIVYIGPFICIYLYIMYKLIKKRKFNIDIIMNVIGVLLAFVLSCLAGYVFFSVSCVLIIICVLSLLYKEVIE